MVERFDHLRDEGQNVDVRGIGREVMRRMGLEDAVRSRHTSDSATAFVDEDGSAYSSFPAGTDDSSGGTAELEILRGNARLLYDHSSGSAEYLFGQEIRALHDDGRGVVVEFTHGPARRFDAVVVAEGSRSRTRQEVLPEAQIDELDLLRLHALRKELTASRWRIGDRTVPEARGRLAISQEHNWIMYAYEFVRLPESGQRPPGDDRLTNYPDLVHERARRGWRLVQVLVEQPAIAAFDRVLIFERATREDRPDANS